MQEVKTNRRNIAIAVWSLAFYLFSLPFPAFYVESGPQPSYFALLFGMLSFMCGGQMEMVIWFANPLYITALFLLFFRKKAAVWLSSIAALLAFCFLLLGEIHISESGTPKAITADGAGYYFWLLSMLILCFGSRSYFKKQNVKN